MYMNIKYLIDTIKMRDLLSQIVFKLIHAFNFCYKQQTLKRMYQKRIYI